MKGFRDFLMRGNLVELAVGVVIGVAFSTLITQFTKSFITPLLGIFGGVPRFANLTFSVNGSQFNYGAFIDALISFVIIAAILYFLVALPLAKALAYAQRNKAAIERDCPECLSSIPLQAKRCAYCTVEIAPASTG
ncbi:MAG: large conductance mechanosensitive channel protein MscL [Streptosporangiales bacterium]|nr:large conductance mechanosensitive channel protein MscL [Streptosporangiales bacterium]